LPKYFTQIPDTARKLGVPDETIQQLSLAESRDPRDIMALMSKMDALLSNEQRLLIMQELGCCKTGMGPKAHRAFGQENREKTLAEKVAILNETKMPHRAPCRLNDDGTLSVYWGSGGKEKRDCPCGYIRKLPESFEVPLTYCGCCGGHIRHNYQKSLGVNLRLKEIVSSSSNSNGEKRCEFLYEVVS